MHNASAIAKLSYSEPLQTWIVYWYSTEALDEVDGVPVFNNLVTFIIDGSVFSYPYQAINPVPRTPFFSGCDFGS